MTRLLVLLSILLACVACRSSEKSDAQTKAASAAPRSNELPPLTVKADTPNLLLTWIDPQGDFHVVQKPADVPNDGQAFEPGQPLVSLFASGDRLAAVERSLRSRAAAVLDQVIEARRTAK